jgi:hypothetical protein
MNIVLPNIQQFRTNKAKYYVKVKLLLVIQADHLHTTTRKHCMKPLNLKPRSSRSNARTSFINFATTNRNTWDGFQAHKDYKGSESIWHKTLCQPYFPSSSKTKIRIVICWQALLTLATKLSQEKQVDPRQ